MAPKKKEIGSLVKLQIPAGKANPSPPVGPALGQAGVNIMEFCNAFNNETKEMQGPIPVVITVYTDKSFTFVKKLPPMSYFIMQELKLKKGSTAPGSKVVAKLTEQQIKNIAEKKMPDLNASTLEAAMKMVRGSATSMGIDVPDDLAA